MTRPAEPRVDDDGTILVSFIYDAVDGSREWLVRKIDVGAFDAILAELNPQETS